MFDVIAWKAFLALNWAAKPNGDADPSNGLNDIAMPMVWEYWKQASDVFLPNGAAPTPWGVGGPSGNSAAHFAAPDKPASIKLTHEH